MSDYSNSEMTNGSYYADVAVLAEIFAKRYGTSVNAAYEWLAKDIEVPSADVQPVVRCKYCQLRADVKDVNTGEMYHTCGALGFIIPDGFACNQGKRKGADNGTDKG